MYYNLDAYKLIKIYLLTQITNIFEIDLTFFHFILTLFTYLTNLNKYNFNRL